MNDDDDDFTTGYRAATDHAGSVAAAAGADAYVSDVQAALDTALSALRDIAAASGNRPIDSVKGFIAEGWHVATFNVDAVRQRLGHRYHAEVLNLNLLRSPDIRVRARGAILDFQSKYGSDAAKVARELSDPLFEPMGKIAAADKVAAIKEAALERAAAEHRPEVAKQLNDTARRVTDRVEVGKVASRPLDHDGSKELVRSARDGSLDGESANLTLDQTLRGSDLAREAAIGAATSAAVSGVLGAAPHVVRGIGAWLDGKPAAERDAHLKAAMQDGAKGLAVGGLRGGVAAGLVIAARTGALGEAARSLSPGAIGALTALVLQGASDAVDLRNGAITGSEFALRFSRNAAAAGGGTIGAGVGQVLIPIPVLGAMIGSVVGSALATTVHAGGVAGLRRLENREAWEEQVALARALGRLASQLEVAAEGTALLLRQSEAELAFFEDAARLWREAAARTDADLARASHANDEVRSRLTQGAVGRLLLAARAGTEPRRDE